MVVAEKKRDIAIGPMNELCEKEGRSNKEIFSLGVIDFEDGDFIGLHNKASVFNEAMLAGLAASAVMMLRGPEVCLVESFITSNTELDISNTIREMYFCTDRITKFLKVVEKWDVLVILVSHIDANMALNWLTVRGMAEKVDSLLAETYGEK